jgi:hypothetical protein
MNKLYGHKRMMLEIDSGALNLNFMRGCHYGWNQRCNRQLELAGTHWSLTWCFSDQYILVHWVWKGILHYTVLDVSDGLGDR